MRAAPRETNDQGHGRGWLGGIPAYQLALAS